jgi:tetratricopeptide (TPR) repeat protein
VESAKWLKDKVTSLIESGVYEEAVPYLERLLQMPGTNPYDTCFAHFTLGEIHFDAGRWFRAQRHFQKVIDIGGNDPFALLLLGQVYCAQGKYYKGREILERAWSLKPDDPAIEISLGTCLCLQTEYTEAEEVFQRVIDRDGSIHEAYLGLAQSLMGQRKWEEARKVLEEARQRFPTVLVIRQALKDLEKIDKLEDFYNWIMDEDIGEAINAADDWDILPIKLARTALVEMQVPPEAIESADRIWEDYLRVGYSIPRVPEAWAAGIIYTVTRLYERADISQTELARRFEVSAASVSRVFRTLSDELKIKKNDPRYRGSKR